MTISQAILWAASNVQPEERSSEIAAASRTSSAPTPAPPAPGSAARRTSPGGVLLGLREHVHDQGIFAAGDASGASSHKFSSGSHAEGRIAGKAAIRYIVNEKPAKPTIDDATSPSSRTLS